MEDQYKPSDEERLKDASSASKHYKSVNLPGDRKMSVSADDVRARIAAMKVEKAKPNHD